MTGDSNANFTASSDALIWSHCQELVDYQLQVLRGKYTIYTLNVEIVEKPERAFLKVTNVTDNGDLWCGNMLVAQKNPAEPLIATNTEQQPLLGSPYEASTWMFEEFQNKWSARSTHENWFVGHL